MVGMHHERLDGGGYHRGCTDGELPLPARAPAAPAPALAPEQAERRLLAGAAKGLLDADAVAAVLAAAGHDVVIPRRRLPAGLSAREVEVLGLVAEGCGNAEIARRLVISRRTAEHHVQHIYTKIGVSSRAAGPAVLGGARRRRAHRRPRAPGLPRSCPSTMRGRRGWPCRPSC